MATIDKTTGSPPMIGRLLSTQQWRAYCESYDFGNVWPDKIVLHHTYKPNIATWQGIESMKAMQKYYAGLGWTSAPHIYVAPEGIWLFTPMKDIGVHARWCNETRNAQGKLTGYSIGVEMVGDCTTNPPDSRVWSNTLYVLGELSQRLRITPRQLIIFHRDCGKPACPGGGVPSEWVWSQTEQWLTSQYGGGLSAYYSKEGAEIYQVPIGEGSGLVRALGPGSPILSDVTVEGGWVHMARFPPLQYDEGFIRRDKLTRVF